MSTLPCYIIGNSVPSMKDGLLFHYTDSKGLFGILESMSLRPSKIQNLNDLNEANLHNYYTRDIFKRKAAKEYIFNHCSIICFTQNYEYDGYCFYGHNRPSQWAYYSNNNNGACIVLDEKTLINANKDKLLNNFTIDDVEYKIDNAHKEMLEEDENVEQFVKKK